MGALFSSTEILASGSYQIPASAEIVEEVARDIDAMPKFITHLVSVERIRGRGCEVGVQWREVREYRGRKVTLYKTITRLSENPFKVYISVDLKHYNYFGENRDAGETFSVAIEPGNDDESCTVHWIFSFVSAGLIGNITSAICSCSTKRALQKYNEKELKCYEQEALRRSKRVGD